MLTSFSPEKVIRYYDRIKNYNDTGNIILPAVVDIDVSNRCNANCYFCISQRVHDSQMLSVSDVENILSQLKVLKLYNICLAGGGDPLTNPNFTKIDRILNDNNFNKILTTNGINLLKVLDDIYSYLFIGISFDCINTKQYEMTRGNHIDNYDLIIKGIEYLNKIKKEHQIKETTAKILITKYNYNCLYDIVYRAKELGFNTAYIRPAGLHHIYGKTGNLLDLTKYKLLSDEVKIVYEQLEKVKELNDTTFFSYCSNQFESDLTTPIYNFDKCIACMFSCTFSADGYVYICMDHRGDPKFRLCKHKEYLKYFNSDFHKQLINNIDFKKYCPRCIKNGTNEIIQQIIKNDINFDFV